MTEATISVQIRTPAEGVAILDIGGQITASAEGALADVHDQATRNGAAALLLDFDDLDYMNSSGIGLLVTLLVRTQRNGQQLGAFGLSDHYREIFELTRLDEAITIHANEAEAVAAAAGGTP